MPFCLLLGPFAALHATVPRLFPVNRLPLYAISVWGRGPAAEERKRGRLGKQSIYSCLFSRARPSWTSGGELCNVTGRAHFPVQSCCCCARTHIYTHTLIPTEEQAPLWRGRMRQKGCCEGISAEGVITRIFVFHQHRIYTQILLSSLCYRDDRLQTASSDHSATGGERGHLVLT